MNVRESVEALMERNRRINGSFRYTVPDPTKYPYQWFWDSCFHAIILSHYDSAFAKDELRALVSKQFQNGMIPHMIYWEEGDVINFDWGTDGTSSITQPPMLAYAVWHIFERDGDRGFLEEMYRSLFHFYKYLLNERDPHERHLVGIINPDESGEDNSPRFDSLLDLPPQHTLGENLAKRLELVEENKTCNFDAPFCMKHFFWVKDVPFNAIFAENLSFLVRIARELGEHYDADYFELKQEEVVGAMRKLMHDSEDGLFYSTHGEGYEKIRVKTWAIFAPLFAGILSDEEARRLVDEHLLNTEEYACEYSAPTVAFSEPSFDPDGFWRGPVWISTNWFIYKGLRRYGLDEEAERIRNSSLTLIEKSGFREYFNPHTGAGLGAHDFTWGGLVLDME